MDVDGAGRRVGRVGRGVVHRRTRPEAHVVVEVDVVQVPVHLPRIIPDVQKGRVVNFDVVRTIADQTIEELLKNAIDDFDLLRYSEIESGLLGEVGRWLRAG